MLLTPFDVKRLESYAKNLVDYHVVLDLLPVLARLFFLGRLPVALSSFQSATLLAIGLQHKSVDDVVAEFTVPANQVLALFNKSMRKFVAHLRAVQGRTVESTLPHGTHSASLSDRDVRSHLTDRPTGEAPAMKPLKETLNEELDADGKRLVSSLAAPEYALVADAADEWKEQLRASGSSALKMMDRSLKGPKDDAKKDKHHKHHKGGHGGGQSQHKRKHSKGGNE